MSHIGFSNPRRVNAAINLLISTERFSNSASEDREITIHRVRV